MNLQENIRRILKEETKQINKSYTLYVDMGGVLFKKMGADEGGSGDRTDYIGAKLWNDIEKYNPTILSATGTADTKNKQNVKTAQVKKYLTPMPPIEFVTLGKDKAKFANKNSILIDDSQANIDAWEGKYGKGIKYDPNDIQTTLVKLKRLYGY